MKELISIQVFFTLTILVIFQVLIATANCPAKPLHKIGLKVNCYIGNSTNSVSCFDSIEVYTKANISCKYGYQTSRDIKTQEITCCDDSEWSEEPMDCQDICVDNTEAVTSKFINNKTERVLSQTPWHVSILIDTRHKQIYNFNSFKCFGVILNAKIILTTYACIRPFDAFEMTVISGKFRYPHDLIETYVQKSGVKKIYTNHNFLNNATDFFRNTQVSILELIQPFEYTEFARSACIDWSAITDEVFNSNPVGFVNCLYNDSIYYIELNSTEFSDIHHHKCAPKVKNPFDIFCSKTYSEQEDFCYPRDGSGIMLKQQFEDGSTKKNLWALEINTLSASPRKDEPRYYLVAIFVNIWYQKDFIMEYMDKFKASNILSYEFTNKACPTVDFYKKKLIAKCEINSEDTPCDNAIKPGTIVRIQCEDGYEKPTIDKPDEIKCLEEVTWSDEFYQCEQLCGKLEKYSNDKTSLVPLIYEEQELNAISVPWQVAIYANNTSDNEGQWTFICEGTITHKKVVMSAASNCFWDSSNNAAFHPSSFLVASGKRYREYNVTEPYEQYSRIRQIRIPPTFNPISLDGDVAVLVLEKHFRFDSYTKPACLTWSSKGNNDFSTGVMGLVSAWSSTSQDSSQTSSELQLLKVSTVDSSSCRDFVDPEYKEFISDEKFCVPGNNSRYSGAGFIAPQTDDSGVERYYLIGVNSFGVNSTEHDAENFVSIYTNIQYHTGKKLF